MIILKFFLLKSEFFFCKIMFGFKNVFEIKKKYFQDY